MINHFAQTNYRNYRQVFGIKQADRRQHLWAVGRTGMGKSNLLETMIINDLRAGRGVGVIDPHGQLAEKILEHVPSWRTEQVCYFSPADTNFPVGLNPLSNVDDTTRSLVVSDVVSLFISLFSEFWGPNTEHIARNALYAVTERQSGTLLNVLRLVNNESYRLGVVRRLRDPIVKSYWLNEFARYRSSVREPALSPLRNKLSQFITNPLIRHIIGQVRGVDLRRIMDQRGIFIANLAKGTIGDDTSRFLGSLLLTQFVAAALRRADTPEEGRPDFNLFIDEIHNFATKAFPTALSEVRKYRLALHLSSQQTANLLPELRSALIANVGSLLAFRLGNEDALLLAREFWPVVGAEDLVNLPRFSIYLKMLIDGVPSRPFSAETLPPDQRLVGRGRIMMEQSRRRYATRKHDIARKIAAVMRKDMTGMGV